MSEIPEKYTIDNAKNDIQNLQNQNKYDFQEIKRLDRLIKEYDKRVLQAINMNNQINKKIQDDYEKFKKSIIDDIFELGNVGGGGSGLTAQQLANLAKIPLIQNTVDGLPNNYATKTHTHSEFANNSHRHDVSEIDNLPSGSGSGLTISQINQLNEAYTHSQSYHVSKQEIPTKTSQLTNNSNYVTESYVETKIYEASLNWPSLPECFITITGGV